MKKIYLILSLGLFTAPSANSKIWRVNNNAGVSADFTTVQAAHDAAIAGDTLHLEPSLNSYGNLNLTKRLNIFSTGNFIAQNPGFQSDIRPGFLSTIDINNTNANNSVIMVRFNGDINIGNNVSSILISNCAGSEDCSFACRNVNINNADNIIIRQSVVGAVNFINNANNIQITNNIIMRHINSNISCDGIVSNNVVFAIGFANSVNLFNCVVSNNIFNHPNSINLTNCSTSNNLTEGNLLPAGNGNQNNIDMSTVFLNHNGGFIDNAYQLKAGSPAIGAGTGGIDCGAFGGLTPFKLAVTPPIPSINSLSVPSSTGGNSMTIYFSARSNN